MRITSDFPGGNIVVEDIAEHSVRLHQDLRHTKGDWFYWCFRADAAAGKTVRFRFTQGPALAARGPAFSTDEGATWNWLGKEAVEDNSFVYTFPPDAGGIFFGMTVPYTEAHWHRFLSGHEGNAPMIARPLCKSRQGRPVESLLLGCFHSAPRHRVLLAARHHCCETMASYVLEGVIAYILTDAPAAAWLREHAEILVVPFMDKDGVEAGDQGKNRRPRDHNRDYDGHSLYPETAALREMIPKWSDKRLHVALDFHCPWLFGESHETLCLVGSSRRSIQREQSRFSEILEHVRQGPLVFYASDNLPFGQKWNTAGNQHHGKSFGRWAAELPGLRLASTMEIPYASARGREVNAATARAFGADVARALAGYLQSIRSL